MEEMMIDASNLSIWDLLPDSLLLDIFTYLDITTLGRAACVCWKWNRCAMDDKLWCRLARVIWKIPKVPLPACRTSWYSEVRRLVYHVPLCETEVFEKHTDEVLDVAISHDGEHFITTSKDNTVVMWKLGFPSYPVQEVNTSSLGWDMSEYACFNQEDTLVLVCGLEMGSDDTYGSGALFTVPGLNLVYLVDMNPPTLFGASLTNTIYIGGCLSTTSGQVKMQAYKIDEASLNHDPRSSHIYEPVHYKRFDGVNQRYLDLLIAYIRKPIEKPKKLDNSAKYDLFEYEGDDTHQMSLLVARVTKSNKICDMLNQGCPDNKENINNYIAKECIRNEIDMHNNDQDVNDEHNCKSTKQHDDEIASPSCEKCQPKTEEHNSCDDNLTTGSNTENMETEHIYILFVTGSHDTIAVIEVTDDKMAAIEKFEKNKMTDMTGNTGELADDTKLTKFDYSFVLEDRYISGMNLSPDNRYLYVNYRKVSTESERRFTTDLTIGIIDLVTMTLNKDIFYKGHIGYSESPVYIITLNVSDNYIGSCSEDHKAYLWDRKYGVALGTLGHRKGVVNGIMFSPTDEETCITVGDDYLVKIWRSKHHVKLLKENSVNLLKERLLLKELDSI